MNVVTPRRAVLALALAAAMLGLPVARGAAPAGRYTLAAETVLDNETGLTWQRAQAVGTYIWANAKTYCTGLTLAGLTGWRLPNVRELQSLVDIRAYSPAIDTTAFPGTSSSYFWSSSPFAYVASYAWLVDFSYGYTDAYDQGNTYYVRCVR